MPSIYELAEKGKQEIRKAEEKRQAEEAVNRLNKTRVPWLSGYKRSTAAGLLGYLGILCICWGLIMPWIDDKKIFSTMVNLAVPGAGVIIILITIFMVYRITEETKKWMATLPFKLPDYYIHFLNTTFSTHSKYSGTSYSDVSIEIGFEYPLDKELVSNAIIGIGQKGVVVGFGDVFDSVMMTELENPVEEPQPPEDDEIYFSTPDKPRDEKQIYEEPRVINIAEGKFSTGNDFHKFFRRLCEEILIPLHKEYNLENIQLYNDSDPSFIRI